MDVVFRCSASYVLQMLKILIFVLALYAENGKVNSEFSAYSVIVSLYFLVFFPKKIMLITVYLPIHYGSF